MVVSHLAGLQEMAAMRGEPVDEVVMVQELLEALLHHQSETVNCLIVVTFPARQREGEGAIRHWPTAELHAAPSQESSPNCKAFSLPLPAIEPRQ